MISVSNIEDITLERLQSLIDNQVLEGKTIEYKSNFPDDTKFLAVISSFANTAGGDLLIGVEEKEGAPTDLSGIEIYDLDKEKQRIVNKLHDSMEPRIPHFDIHPVKVSDNKYVLVIRVDKSWTAPHRVKKNRKFHGRNSAGCYELDVGELRTAFTLSETIYDRMRDFRDDRLAKIMGGETPVPLMQGGLLVLHVIPLDAFTTKTMVIDILTLQNSNCALRAMGNSCGNSLINFHGYVRHTSYRNDENNAYTQTFRTGAAEAVCLISSKCEEAQSFNQIFDGEFYKEVIDFLERYISFADEFSINFPYYCFLSFIGVKNSKLRHGQTPNFSGIDPNYPAINKESDLILPEVAIEEHNVHIRKIMDPVFEMVFNAFDISCPLPFKSIK